MLCHTMSCYVYFARRCASLPWNQLLGKKALEQRGDMDSGLGNKNLSTCSCDKRPGRATPLALSAICEFCNCASTEAFTQLKEYEHTEGIKKAITGRIWETIQPRLLLPTIITACRWTKGVQLAPSREYRNSSMKATKEKNVKHSKRHTTTTISR